jgi:hypothetical protein
MSIGPDAGKTAGSLAEIGQRNLHACIGAQSEFLNTVGTLHSEWTERANAEVRLVSELASELSKAQNLGDAAAAYQRWMMKRMQMLTEDGQKFIALAAKITQTTPPGGRPA